MALPLFLCSIKIIDQQKYGELFVKDAFLSEVHNV